MHFLRRWLPVAIWGAIILTASNDTFSSAQSRTWLVKLAGYDVPQWIHFSIRKTAHVIEYAVLAFLSFRAAAATFTMRSWHPFYLAVLLSTAVATADEVRQGQSRARSGSAADVFLDVAAAAVTAVIMRGRGADPRIEG